jgi:putative FmdB family regulatory protein
VPTYSYRCTECGEAFDIVQAFTDDTLTVCPNCGGLLRKVFSPVGVSFSGSGFYRTDSRAAENKKKDAAGSGESSSSSGGSSADSAGSSGSGGSSSESAGSSAGGSESKPATPSKTSATKSDKKSTSKKEK